MTYRSPSPLQAPSRTQVRNPNIQRGGSGATERGDPLPPPDTDQLDPPPFAKKLAFAVGLLLVLASPIDAIAGVPRFNLLSLLVLCALYVAFVPGAAAQVFSVNPYVVSSTLLFLCLSLGVLETRVTDFATTKTIRFGLYWVVIPAMFYSIGSNTSLSRSLFYGIACAGVLQVFFVFFHYGSPTQLAKTTQQAGGRLGFEEQGPIGVARALGLAVVGFIFVIQRKVFSIGAIIAAVFLLLTMPYLFFSGTRTVMFALFLSIAAAAVIVLPLAKSSRMIILACLICLFIVFFALNFGGEDYLVKRFATVFQNFEEADNRTGRWLYTLRLISKFSVQDWIIGKGTADFAAVMAVFGTTTLDHPHNIFLELLYENGVLGVSVFIILLAFVGMGLLSLRHAPPEWRDLGFAAAVGFFFALVNAQASFDMSRNFWIDPCAHRQS